MYAVIKNYHLSKILFNRTKSILKKGTDNKNVYWLHSRDKMRNLIYKLKTLQL